MVLVLWSPAVFASEAEPRALSIAEFQDVASQRERVIESFRIEGVVCAVTPMRKLIALQDSSATILLEVPRLDETVHVKDRVAVIGRNCAIDQTRFGTHLGTLPTVDLDGTHPAISKSGRIFLNKGFQPIRLSWFNATGESALKLEYEYNGQPRQRIPDERLWWLQAPEDFEPGLAFEAYTGNALNSIADFENSAPVASGVARNFDRRYSVRPENAGLIFTGCLEVLEAGIYTFRLESNDGARLYVGAPEGVCKIEALDGTSAPKAMALEEALAARNHAQWIEAEGTVNFVAANAGDLEAEMDWRGERLRITVLDGAALQSSLVPQRHLRIMGLCEAARNMPSEAIRVTIPSANLVEVEPPLSNSGNTVRPTLGAARQVRELGYAEAEKHLPVALQGVVTYASHGVMMLQDPTGAVFVLTGFRPERPIVGDLWEVEGLTEGGGFAPNVRASKIRFAAHSSLPEPIRATWDQLMNGSLDVQYVEIEGVLTAASDKDLTILTRGGNVVIRDNVNYPLPRLLTPASQAESYIGSVLRIRGVLSVPSDARTRQAFAGNIRMGSARVSIEEKRPDDPFCIPEKKASDLRLFNSRASVFQRTKLLGKILFARPGEAFLIEEKTGIRLLAKELPSLRPGDLVEAVGFPQFGGPSLALQEAQVRVIGKANLPEPDIVASTDLLDQRRDATLVQVEAMLVGDTAIRGERVLEVLAGGHHFLARLAGDQHPDQTLRTGSRLQLRGVYSWTAGKRDAESPDGFELLLDNPAAITVLHSGPWWTERRIYAAAGILAGALALAVVWIALLRRKVEERTSQWQKEVQQRQRAEQRRAVEQERTRVAQDLHDELGTGLTQVGLLGELAKSRAISAETKDSYLGQLTDAARSLVTGLDEIVWAVNPQYDSVASLASYYALFAQRLLELAGIACRIEKQQLPEHPLDASVRHGVFLAFKEALNNIVRHSSATEVRLSIQVACDQLVLSITDNGCGFATDAMATGDGLVNMRQRMAALGGQCEIDSAPGRGARVKLNLPIEQLPP